MSRVIISRSSPTPNGDTFMRLRSSSLPPGMDLSASTREIHVQTPPGGNGATRILLTRNGNIHSVDRISADSSLLSHSSTSGYGNSIINSDYSVLHSPAKGIVINTAPLTPTSQRNTNTVAYQLIHRQPTLSSVSTKQSNNSIFIGQTDFREHQYDHQAKSIYLTRKLEPESACLKPPLPSVGLTTFRVKTGNGSTGFLFNGVPGSAQRICLRGNNTSIGIQAHPNFRVSFLDNAKIRVISGGSLDNIHSAIHNPDSPDENSLRDHAFSVKLHKSKPNQPSLLINKVSAPMHHQQDRRASNKGIYSRVKIPSTTEESRRHDFYAMDSLKLYEAQLDLNEHSQQVVSQSPPSNQFVSRSSYRLGDYRSTFKPQKDSIPPQAPPRTFYDDKDCSRNQNGDSDLKRNYYLPQSNQIDVKTTTRRSEEYDSLTSTVLKKRFKSSDQSAAGATGLDLPSQNEVVIVDNNKQYDKEDAINNNTIMDSLMDHTLSAVTQFFPVKTSDSIRLLPPHLGDYSNTLPMNDTLTATLASTLSGGSSSLPSEELLDVSRSFSNQCSLEDGQDLLSDPASRHYAGDMISDLDGNLSAQMSIQSESEASPTSSRISNDTYAFSTLDSEYLLWMSYNIRTLSQFEVERTQCAAANLMEFAPDDLTSLISQFNTHCLSDWSVACVSFQPLIQFT
ncbi:hypothetical protein Ciccas_007661 [Cichlidogyrus casuarinus]|uniref:Uncharacterized protein n=1 Tax=Cichlidogyrus casuarinus TaxID=1844966 RepID=A0ABD2Q3E4_9PLAT